MSNSHQRNFGLDFARALAISLVVASHFGHSSFGELGFWGVELFFALSGFLIGQILWRNFSRTTDWNTKRIFNFWSRRWWRTLPNYYLFFLIAILLAYVNSENIPSLSRLFTYLWFGQNLISFYWGFYVIAWSLCIEEWFYLLFPIVLFCFAKLGLTHKASFIGTLLIFFVGSFIMREFIISNGGGNELRTTTLARLDSIACGVLVSFILTIFTPRLMWKRIAFMIGLLLVFLPIVCASCSNIKFDQWIQNSVILFAVPFGFALMLPVINLLPLPVKGKIIPRVIEKISLWSYSIYLSHLAIMWQVYLIMNNYRSYPYGNLLAKIIGLALTILVSAFLFRYIEKPLTQKRPVEIK